MVAVAGCSGSSGPGTPAPGTSSSPAFGPTSGPTTPAVHGTSAAKHLAGAVVLANGDLSTSHPVGTASGPAGGPVATCVHHATALTGDATSPAYRSGSSLVWSIVVVKRSPTAVKADLDALAAAKALPCVKNQLVAVAAAAVHVNGLRSVTVKRLSEPTPANADALTGVRVSGKTGAGKRVVADIRIGSVGQVELMLVDVGVGKPFAGSTADALMAIMLHRAHAANA
jgi:hypothetical protein